MSVINIMVRRKTAANPVARIVCGNSDYKIAFNFDEEWAAHDEKTARFIWNGQYADVVFTGNVCDVPVITNTTMVAVGVYTGDLRTTTPALIRCDKSILCGSAAPITPGGGKPSGGLTTAQVNALDGMFKVVAYALDARGAYAAFKTAFGLSDSESGGGSTGATLTGISATYSGGEVEVGTALTDLVGIVVEAIYSDGTTTVVADYTLSGEITSSTNEITVSYEGFTTTFVVTASMPTAYYLLDKVSTANTDMSYAYADDGTTKAGFRAAWCQMHYFGSEAVEKDTKVKIRTVADDTNVNGVYVYSVRPESFAGYSSTMYYGVAPIGSTKVDTEYEWEYTIRAGYALGMTYRCGTAPTVEVIS